MYIPSQISNAGDAFCPVNGEGIIEKLLALNRYVFFGADHFFLAPFLFSISFGLALAINTVVKIALYLMALVIPVIEVPKYQIRNSKSVLGLVTAVCFSLPYQYVNLIIFLLLLFSTIQTKKLYGVTSEKPSRFELRNRYHYQQTLTVLYLIPVFLQFATMLVWMKNLMIGWWSFSDYDGFSAFPFSMLVLLSKGEMFRADFYSINFIAKITIFSLILYFLLFANFFSFFICKVSSVITVILLVYHIRSIYTLKT